MPIVTRAVKKLRAHDQNQNQSPSSGVVWSEALFEEMMCKLSEEGREGVFQLSDKVRPYKEALACAKPTPPPKQEGAGCVQGIGE